MEYKRPQKLSVLIEKNKPEFARKVTDLVKKNYDEYSTYHDKCDQNERVWRNKNWDNATITTKTDAEKPQPNVPILHSIVEFCVADIIDNAPGQVIRGVGNDDDIKALIVTELMRFIFQRANYPHLFEKKIRAALKRGEGMVQPYLNPELADGMGDVDFRYKHVKNYVWDRSVDDVNDGRFFAIIDYVQPEELYELYPKFDPNIAMPETEAEQEQGTNRNDDIRVKDDNGNIKVITFMWKERVPRMVDGEQLGHITYINTAIICGTQVLEYELEQYEYDRFFVNILTDLEIEGEPVGLSELDLHKDDADTVSMIQQSYLCNLQESEKERFFVKRNAGINKKALLDHNQRLVEGDQIHPGAINPFKPTPFSNQVLQFQQFIIAGIKERSGQDVFNIGNVRGNVSSGIGIQEMKESGSKRSRLRLSKVYEDHKNTVKDVLKIAQTHYETKRVIRLSREAQNEIEKRIEKAIAILQQQATEQGTEITPEMMASAGLPEGVSISGNELTIDFSVFSIKDIDLDYDIEIVPQRMDAATSSMLNSTIAQMLNNPEFPFELAFELLEFPGKEKITKKVREYMDMERKVQSATQSAQQSAEQAQQLADTVQKQAKEIEKLKNNVWSEKLKAVRQLISEQEEAEETDPEKMVNELEAEIFGNEPAA